jgi:adenine-specific DNA-methyltransferase
VPALHFSHERRQDGAYRGAVSLPFEPGRRVAVKIVDDRGIESLKVIGVKG